MENVIIYTSISEKLNSRGLKNFYLLLSICDPINRGFKKKDLDILTNLFFKLY